MALSSGRRFGGFFRLFANDDRQIGEGLLDAARPAAGAGAEALHDHGPPHIGLTLENFLPRMSWARRLSLRGLTRSIRTTALASFSASARGLACLDMTL